MESIFGDSRLAFRVEAVKGVAQVGEELLAGGEAAGGR